MIDALPDDMWVIPVAVSAALLDDEHAQDEALAATAQLREQPEQDWWRRAAKHGLADPVLAKAAQQCFAAARDATTADAGLGADVDAFIERYVQRGRCPADDWDLPA
jgi:glutamate--cysteine ligase